MTDKDIPQIIEFLEARGFTVIEGEWVKMRMMPGNEPFYARKEDCKQLTKAS